MVVHHGRLPLGVGRSGGGRGRGRNHTEVVKVKVKYRLQDRGLEQLTNCAMSSLLRLQ